MAITKLSHVKISIHAPARGATDIAGVHENGIFDFNPRSREGSDLRFGYCHSVRDNFNPRSREGSDTVEQSDYSKKKISIHAPARGATGFFRLLPAVCLISIHAPARGATYHLLQYCSGFLYFNPRSREGSDQIVYNLRILLIKFQSTLPRGERPWKNQQHEFLQYFNPRSREGSDIFRIPASKLPYVISIHAPARGATPSSLLPVPESRISIHAPARGATFYHSSCHHSRYDFNPRSREGSDKYYVYFARFAFISIHAPARGATSNSWIYWTNVAYFNPRSREGSDFIR